MLSFRNALRSFGLAVTLLATSSAQPSAGELVQFDATSAGAGSLKLLGSLARPRGPQAGPSPAVVILHHCGGFDDLVVSWADRLSLWGYVALDSFGPRKVPRGWASRTYQQFDSSSAFDLLSQRNFVDGGRLRYLAFHKGVRLC